MLIQGKILSSKDDISEAFNIRRKVFVEELGYEEKEVFDAIDSNSMHVLIFEDNPQWREHLSSNTNKSKSVATGRIYFDGVKCEISQVAVLEEYRRLKYGDFAVRMLINKAFTSGINEVSLISTLDVSEFFESIGFRKTSESYLEDGLEKCSMQIRPDDLIKLCQKNSKK